MYFWKRQRLKVVLRFVVYARNLVHQTQEVAKQTANPYPPAKPEAYQLHADAQQHKMVQKIGP